MSTKTIYGTKKTIEDAFSEINFEEYKKYVPTHRKNEWAKKVTKLFIELSEEKKESIFIVSAFITMFYKYFRCFWTPWTMGESTRKKAFNYEFIEESYESIMQIVDEFPDIEDNLAVKAYYEHLYGYLLVEDFLKGINEIYWSVLSTHPIIVTRSTMVDNGLMILFTGLSIRGTHRTKIWPTFFHPENSYSRRATTGKYQQLTPQSYNHFKGIESIERKVNWLLNGTRELAHGKKAPALFIDALHPHISVRNPCLGGWANRLSRNAEYGYSRIFMKDIKGYLCTWSPTSPYWNINHRFRKTYEFPDFKGKKKCHWDGVDSEYIRIMYPDIYKNDFNWNVARLAMQQKHELGYYTESFLAKYEDFLYKRKIGDRRVCQILNMIANIDFSDNSTHRWTGLVNNGYMNIYNLKANGWAMPPVNSHGRSLSLIAKIKSAYLSRIFDDVIIRASHCIKSSINIILEESHWSSLNPENLTNDSLACSLRKSKKIETIYKDIWKTMDIKEYENRTLLHEDPLNSNYYYNTYVLNLIIDYKSMKKLFDNWIILTYEREISNLTNLTKELSNELTNHTTYARQSQLFSEDISV